MTAMAILRPVRASLVCALLFVAVLLFEFSQAGKSGKKKKEEKTVVYRLQVTGQKEFQLVKGDEPCRVLKKYCKALASGGQLDFASVFHQLYDTVSAQLIKLWTSVHADLKADESLFVRCQAVFIAPDMKAELDKDALMVSLANRTRRHKELLGLLKEAVEKRDADALSKFNRKRPLYKLTDIERYELYRRAVVLLPGNSFMIDQFGLALMAVGRPDLAKLLFEGAVKRGVWGNINQRPVSKYVPNLTAKPWHDPKDYPFLRQLEEGQKDIWKEYSAAQHNHPHLFTEEAENLHRGGNWTELRLKSSGYGWLENNCQHFPKTMKTLRSIDKNFTSIKFSSILPGTHIRPHTGPTNERLRIHLTLQHKGGARIRVNDEWHSWPQGKAIIFDDSWEHEVLNEGEHERTVLILDIWHPELPEHLRVVH